VILWYALQQLVITRVSIERLSSLECVNLELSGTIGSYDNVIAISRTSSGMACLLVTLICSVDPDVCIFRHNSVEELMNQDGRFPQTKVDSELQSMFAGLATFLPMHCCAIVLTVK
jgi:hypothetical protein